MCVTLQCPLPSLYVFACKNGRVVAELWSSCAEYRASCAEYRASCGRVVRVLGELLGEIVKFRQLAQKRLGGHLWLGGVGTPSRGPLFKLPFSRKSPPCISGFVIYAKSKKKKTTTKERKKNKENLKNKMGLDVGIRIPRQRLNYILPDHPFFLTGQIKCAYKSAPQLIPLHFTQSVS